MIAFPIKVAPKNTHKLTPKCPHKMPAKSNKGFGILAHIKIVTKPCFFKDFAIKFFA